MSYPRFTLTVFPLYVALALYTRDRPRAHKVVVVVGVVPLIVFTAQVRHLQLGGVSRRARAGRARRQGERTGTGRPGDGVAPGVWRRARPAAPTRLNT